MKCGILITLALATIYCFEICDGGRRPIEARANEKKESLEENYRELMAVYELHLEEWEKKVTALWKGQEGPVDFLMKNARLTYVALANKTEPGNEKVKDCLNMSNKRLTIIKNQFFSRFNFTTSQERTGIRAKANIDEIEKDRESVMGQLENVRKKVDNAEVALALVSEEHKRLNGRIHYWRRVIPKKLEKAATYMSKEVTNLLILMNQDVDKLTEEFKKCIAEARIYHRTQKTFFPWR